YQGRIDFEWTREELLKIAQRSGVGNSLVNSEVIFFANVTDWYSDLNRTGWAGTIMFDDTVHLEWVGGSVRTFKPGQLFKVQVAVSQYDGKPVLDGGAVTVVPTIMVSGDDNTPAGNPLTSPVINGIAYFEIQLSLNTKQFQLSINEYMVFHVTTSHFVKRIYYQIIAQSNVIIGDELEMTSRQKTFAVGLSRAMVPAARMLVYFVWQPEEVVSDVLSFFVNGTSQNMVTLGINRGKDFSRDTVEFNAYADPGSYMAFSAMLLDLYNRGLSDGITENKLIDELMSYDSTSSKGYKHLQRVSDTEYEYKFFHGYDMGIDSTTTFESAGLLILTDADVTRLPNMDSCDPQAGLFPCFSGVYSECFQLSQKCDGKMGACPSDGADEWGCEYKDTEHAVHQSGMDRVSRVMRFYDNSSWAWQEIFVKPDGRVDFRVDVPKYPLSWVINGISVSRDLGLGIMRQPVRLDAARTMYIQVEHPKYIVWGEQIGVRVTVFNYWYDDDYLEVLVTMHAGRDAEFVLVEDMGWVTAYNPDTHEGDHQTIVFLEPGESRDIYMPIVAKASFHGEKFQFRVSATCFMEKDEYTGEMFLQPNGVLNYYHTPYLIDLIRFPSMETPSLKVEVQEQFREVEVRENVYVPQSPTAMVTLYGDVVTPGFFEDILNAENILYRPYGGGEMAVFNFAYNVQVLLFQRASDQVNDDEEKRVLLDLNIVLQRMLSYMNAEEGSFKMFRDDKKSSLWLTSFVLKSLAHAREKGDWEKYLYIPNSLLEKLVTYICSRQNLTSGAFEPDEADLAFDRKMASIIDSKENLMLTHPVPLTAYVLIALSKISGFKSAIEPAKRNAARYLAEQATSLDEREMFFLAITTYALTLTQSKGDLVDRLWKLGRNDSDYVYFADQRVYSNPTKMINTEFYRDPRQELLNDAYAVQTTAYALMAHIQSNRFGKTERDLTMTWMNSMRNSFAGFSSTQIETNRYARAIINVKDQQLLSNCSRFKLWTPVTLREMWNFIAICIHMGLDKKPTLHDYWTRHPVLHSSFAPKPDCDPIQKIRPFVDYLNAKFKEVNQPQREVCIDEAMIPFKGSSRFKVYMKDKPTKWGFKLYELCESSSGYVWSVEMYCADRRISNKPVDVTMRQLQPLLDQGYRLYVDNYYCCPDLWNQMQGRNTMLVGTCRKNRVGMPADLFQNRQRPGDFDFRRKGQLVATRWFDKREVVTLSTIHQPQLTETIGRYEEEIPEVVEKTIFHLLTLVGVQTTILLNKHRTQHRRRRTNLASVLKEVSVALVDKDVIYDPQADNVPLPMDRLKGRHFLSVCPNTEASDSRGKKAQRRCKVCADRAKAVGQTPAERKNKILLTTTWCPECKVCLCLDCFEIYHTKRDYINN
ncbi:Cd109 antigen-like isoform x3, partial [Plakobranchus ocellatus]